MDIDASNSSSYTDGIIPQTERSRPSELIGMSKNERSRVLRALKANKQHQATKAVEVSSVQTRSMLRQKQTQRA
jgi:hypothetical protein